MTLKKYILDIRKITITKAAEELGYTRPHLSSVCNGLAAGRKLAEKISNWSNGEVSIIELLYPDL